MRDLAEKAADPFIKRRLRDLVARYRDLVARYEDDDFKTASTLTPIDLQFESRGTGPEK